MTNITSWKITMIILVSESIERTRDMIEIWSTKI